MRIAAFLLLTLATLTRCSLLEMSRSLWARLLAGGITKAGSLDPLRVPLVKVDQSEDDITYRMVLRHVEVRGLNDSTLESIHVARGRLKSNLSDSEAGYVSYSDLRDLDSIRYRYHTLVKESKYRVNASRDVEEAPTTKRNHLEGVTGRSNNSSRSRQDVRSDETTSDDAFARVPDPEESDYSKFAKSSSRGVVEGSTLKTETAEGHPERVHLVYPETSRTFGNSEVKDLTRELVTEEVPVRHQEDGVVKCFGSCRSRQGASREERLPYRIREGFRGAGDRRYSEEQVEDADASASQNSETRQQSVRPSEKEESVVQTHNFSRDSRPSGYTANRSGDNVGNVEATTFTRGHRRYQEAEVGQGNLEQQRGRGSAGNQQRGQTLRETTKDEYESVEERIPIEKRPGFVDIIYADDKDQTVKHFGNFKVEPDKDAKVYGLDEIMKALQEHRRYVIHNFTDDEFLRKRNDMARIIFETGRIKDLTRYAKDFQERDGYFEQGMQLIYYFGFGGMDPADEKARADYENSTFNEAKRKKREHLESVEDDVMHVILRIRVPLLRVKASYVLTGKVGKEVLRGNGVLTGNFTDLVGDFTIELKEVNENLMIVRAARAKLVSKKKNVLLQGMDEAGPVNAILAHGLMAAEAVAAMLADDLATKALSETVADAMIYKMYKNPPVD